MQTLWQDLRYGARMLLKNPGFTLVAVMTLALGIGATTAIFSVVNGVLLRPLDYHEPQEIVTLLNHGRGPVSPANFLDFRANSQSFAQMAAAEAWGGTLASNDRPESIAGLRMGDGLFQLLGVSAVVGPHAASRRLRTGQRSRAGAEPQALATRVWRRPADRRASRSR